jgi:hypothetical protein
MSRTSLTAGAVALALAPAFASAQVDERTRLQRHLGLPETAEITVAPVPGIPAAQYLKVYLALGMDMQVRENFTNWIAKWNEKDGNRDGKITLVGRLEDSEVIFARISVREEKQTHLDTAVRSTPTSTTSTTTGGAQAGGTYATGQARTTTYGSTTVTRQYTYDTVPVFAYILRRTPTGVEVLWRYNGDVAVDELEGRNAGRRLFDDFKKLAKTRPRI